VLRLVGTRNSKNGGLVYALRDAGPRRVFEELAASILSADLGEDERQSGADLYDLRVQRAVRPAPCPEPNTRRRGAHL
jgi:hypothetical protein